LADSDGAAMSGFPVTPARESGTFASEPPHRIFWQRHGTAGGRPVLLLHGGPGSGMSDRLIALCDPARFDIVSFDQRGSGRSTPWGALEANDLPGLVADIETLRALLGIDAWPVIGGSWGSTLALAYAEAFPERVERMVLWGIFLLRPADIEWYLYAIRAFLPEAWHAFAAAAGWRKGDDLLECFRTRVFEGDAAVSETAAFAWKNFERRRGIFDGWDTTPELPPMRTLVNMTRIMIHYFANEGRAATIDLLGGADRLRGIPGTIVHGRYDFVGPFEGADTLAHRWPEAELCVPPKAGHAIDDPAINAAVMAAIARL
jgi:proline iminopeptidase